MEEKYRRYNRGLVNRFISDYKLPINMNKEKYFFYFLNLYEKEFGAYSKWKKLWDMIDQRFDGNPEKFLKAYYDLRETIIDDVINSNAYRDFDTMDMSEFKVTDRPDVTKNNIYNCENDGKYFLSIDMTKANFQSLRYVNKDIVRGADSYRDFIGTFTDLDYIKGSKYSRQVIFGKMNPKRHITVEKYLINKVWKEYEKLFPDDSDICSMSNDEIVICNNNLKELSADDIKSYTDKVVSEIKTNIDIDIHVEYFRLDSYRLVSVDSGSLREPFFVKTNIATDEKELMCVPSPYYAIVYKLLNNILLDEFDYHFIYEGLDCKFMDRFILRRFNDTKETNINSIMAGDTIKYADGNIYKVTSVMDIINSYNFKKEKAVCIWLAGKGERKIDNSKIIEILKN